jgi:ribosomal protein S18 acetylase RimI-like enzyme
MVIRRATPDDREALGRLGALLMDAHYQADPRRFLEPGAHASDGYGDFLQSRLGNRDCVVLVAEIDGAVAGYCYASIEPLSWNELRDRAGFVHDLVCDPAARGRGAGRALLEGAIAWLRAQGLPRVVLWTAAGNTPALRLFEQSGFRHTMTELTLELQ